MVSIAFSVVMRKNGPSKHGTAETPPLGTDELVRQKPEVERPRRDRDGGGVG